MSGEASNAGLRRGICAEGFCACTRGVRRELLAAWGVRRGLLCLPPRRKAVDLWGGIRNKATGEQWEENTMVLVFSATKGLAAMALTHSRGLLDYEEYEAFRKLSGRS